MTELADQPLPTSWTVAQIADAAVVNPSLTKSEIDDELVVSFVPMPAVEAGSGRMDVTAGRRFAEVKKGYTPFQEGDVLFAKITPCMENGKMAVVPALKNGHGFGSTEFHVLRPRNGISAKYLYYFVSSQRFRFDADHNMTGAVGQRRVPTTYLAEHPINLPPANEQRRIVAKIEDLFLELDKGVESLTAAREQLKAYRQSVLKHAFEGKLTEEWRSGNNSTPTWQTLRVAELLAAPLCNGRSVKDRVGGFPVLRLTALKRGRIDLTETKEGAWDRATALPFLVAEGDFFVARGNGSKSLVGIGGLVGEVVHDVAFPDTMIRLRLDTSKVDPRYFALCWNSRLVRQQIEQDARTTAGIYKINQNHISAFSLPLPPLDEQTLIVTLLQKRLYETDFAQKQAENEIGRSVSLRQSILRKAFSGQLVPQNASEEPASVLLERIRAGREEGSMKKRRNIKKKELGTERMVAVGSEHGG